MEFKKVKNRREWRDTEKLGYRVTQSITNGLPIRFYACIRVFRESDGHRWWNFAWHRRPYKTFNKAVEACEFNRKIWAAVVALGEATGRRKGRLDALDQRGRRGGGNVLSTVPVWAKPQCDPVLLRMLSPYTKRASQGDDECNSPCVLGETSSTTPTTSADSTDTPHTPACSSSSTPENGHASSAKATDESMTQATAAATSAAPKRSSARGAKGPKSAPKPSTGKSSGKRSKGTSKPRKRTNAY